MPYGFCVWATGNGAVSVVSETVSALGEGAQAEAQAQARGGGWPWTLAAGARAPASCAGLRVGGLCLWCASLPATAQVAAQQGEYLAGHLRGAGRYDLGASNRRAGGRIDWTSCSARRKAMASSRGRSSSWDLDIGLRRRLEGAGAGVGGDSTRKGHGEPGFALWRSVYLGEAGIAAETGCSSRATGSGTAIFLAGHHAVLESVPIVSCKFIEVAAILHNLLTQTLSSLRIIHKRNGPESSPSSSTATSLPDRSTRYTLARGRARQHEEAPLRHAAFRRQGDARHRHVRALHSSTSAASRPPGEEAVEAHVDATRGRARVVPFGT